MDRLKVQILVLILSLGSCQSDDVNPIIPNNQIKIKSIEGLGEVVYKNNKISSIGNENYYYDDKGRLVTSRIHEVDTSKGSFNGEQTIYVYQKVIKYSFMG